MGERVVAVADTFFPDLGPARAALATVDATLRMVVEPTPEAIVAAAADADALLVTYAKLTADVIGRLDRCQVIGRFGIGTDNIDLGAAAAAGIVVTYAPVYCLDEVSDHAMALLLTLASKTALGDNLVHGGRWEMAAVVPIGRLRDRTLGLVGFGNIPQRVAPKAQAFGIDFIATDPYAPEQAFERLGVARAGFEELLGSSGYVSVHAPLTPETAGMFNSAAFDWMRPGALLVNTARGPLVDVEALADALEAGKIAGAALDVMPQEPPPADCGLLGRPDVILTPHTGLCSEEALLDLQTTVATDVATPLSGGVPRFPVKAPG